MSPLTASRLRVFLIAVMFTSFGCRTIITPPKNTEPLEMDIIATAYCSCGKCCGWKRNWLFQPVYASGPQKGRRKSVGITASGKRARMGTISADPGILPYGTVLYVPGYGYGRVEDTGGAIKGNRIELFFDSHRKALAWGRRAVTAKVWMAPGRRQR